MEKFWKILIGRQDRMMSGTHLRHPNLVNTLTVVGKQWLAYTNQITTYVDCGSQSKMEKLVSLKEPTGSIRMNTDGQRQRDLGAVQPMIMGFPLNAD